MFSDTPLDCSFVFFSPQQTLMERYFKASSSWRWKKWKAFSAFQAQRLFHGHVSRCGHATQIDVAALADAEQLLLSSGGSTVVAPPQPRRQSRVLGKRQPRYQWRPPLR